MNILFYLSSFPVASETFVIDQITGLLRRGHDVSIYADGIGDADRKTHDEIATLGLLGRLELSSPPFARQIDHARSGAGRLVRWGWRSPTTLFDALSALSSGRPALSLAHIHQQLPAWRGTRRYDVIHGHFGPNGVLASKLRSLSALSGPIITSFHGYDVNRLPNIVGQDMYKRLFKTGELFTVGSDFLRARVISLGAPESRVIKHPMGVDLSRFTYRERAPNPDGVVRILTVARLVEVKGIEYALHAFAIARQDFAGLKYTVVGDGPLRDGLRALAGHLGILDSVEFLGQLPREKVIEQYERADVFILPSVVGKLGDEEAQSVALAEAQACGLPVISTRTGGIPESMRDGISGILVAPRSADELARAIGVVAGRPESWGYMGRAGRSYVGETFDADKLNERLIKLYHSLSDPGDKHVCH